MRLHWTTIIALAAVARAEETTPLTWEQLRERFECPAWFSEAKLATSRACQSLEVSHAGRRNEVAFRLRPALNPKRWNFLTLLSL
jgi:hypothetical protein